MNDMKSMINQNHMDSLNNKLACKICEKGFTTNQDSKLPILYIDTKCIPCVEKETNQFYDNIDGFKCKRCPSFTHASPEKDR